MDYKHYTEFLSENCPGVPIHLEIISNSPRPVPYLTAKYWDGFPDLPASGITDFLKLVRMVIPVMDVYLPKSMIRK